MQDLRQVKVEIKGMTCEIGCARLIQSKLYKADGVTFAKISFEDSSGIVSFDQNRINEDGIKAIIENTAGGDIYSVASILKSILLLRMMNYSNLNTLTFAFENEMFLICKLYLTQKL